MGRRKKVYTLEEMLEQNQTETENLKQRLTELEEERKQLLEQKRQESISKLYEVMEKSGKTVEDLMELLG